MTSSRGGSISGFPELLPSQRAVEQTVIDTLRATFELHGFAGVETRAVEPLDVLLRKGDIDKEVYLLRRLHSDGEEETTATTLGLHYDLTVPFARYVLENAGHLEFPFRRYQIQRVWRGERPQEGRYREFTQADIDIVARGELPFHHDVEVARVMAQALGAMPFLPPVRLQVNNRRLIEGFYRGLGANDMPAVMRVVDKLDKAPGEVIAALLVEEAGLSDEQAQVALQFAGIRSADASFADQVRGLGVDNDLLRQGLDELAAVVTGCASFVTDRFAVEADLRIARGLDYYTGTVFETRMTGFESLGSICSGGRYDSLASDGKVSYPGVGISLGLTRLLHPLLQRGVLTGSRAVPSVVLVALPAESDRGRCDAIAQTLRDRGIAAEVAAAPQKYGRQIRYAERRGIPFVWFPAAGPVETDGEAVAVGDEVKDIRSGEQESADPHRWEPPADDLRAQVENQRVGL